MHRAGALRRPGRRGGSGLSAFADPTRGPLGQGPVGRRSAEMFRNIGSANTAPLNRIQHNPDFSGIDRIREKCAAPGSDNSAADCQSVSRHGDLRKDEITSCPVGQISDYELPWQLSGAFNASTIFRACRDFQAKWRFQTALRKAAWCLFVSVFHWRYSWPVLYLARPSGCSFDGSVGEAAAAWLAVVACTMSNRLVS